MQTGGSRQNARDVARKAMFIRGPNPIWNDGAIRKILESLHVPEKIANNSYWADIVDLGECIVFDVPDVGPGGDIPSERTLLFSGFLTRRARTLRFAASSSDGLRRVGGRSSGSSFRLPRPAGSKEGKKLGW